MHIAILNMNNFHSIGIQINSALKKMYFWLNNRGFEQIHTFWEINIYPFQSKRRESGIVNFNFFTLSGNHVWNFIFDWYNIIVFLIWKEFSRFYMIFIFVRFCQIYKSPWEKKMLMNLYCCLHSRKLQNVTNSCVFLMRLEIKYLCVRECVEFL